jgi:hypothetical protein
MFDTILATTLFSGIFISNFWKSAMNRWISGSGNFLGSEWQPSQFVALRKLAT